MKARFEISQEEFQGRKKRRIEEMRKPARTCPTSFPVRLRQEVDEFLIDSLAGRCDRDESVCTSKP